MAIDLKMLELDPRSGGGSESRRVTPVGSRLGSASAPSLLLPGEHFAAALVFWVLGGMGLVWVAPDLARGLFPLPRVIAVAHLFTLGWITTTILGALYQFLPVALRVPIRSAALAHLSFGAYVPGLVLFVAGLIGARHGLMLAGAVLFGSALLLFVANLAGTLWRCRDRDLTWWALSGASFFLLATVVLGVLLTGNLERDFLGAERFLALGVHIHVAVGGWVMLVVVGVAHKLLPMFLLSHGAPEWPGRLAVVLLSAGSVLLLALHHQLGPAAIWTVAVLLGGGLVAFVGQAVLFFRRRVRPALDPGMRLVAAALGFLATALILAPAFLVNGLAAPRLATAYVLALLLGGISHFVAGHYYKIVPFLVWFHRFGPLAGTREVPKVADLYDPRVANAIATLLVSGTLGLIVATLAGYVPLARPSAVVFALGAGGLALQMLTIVRRRPA
jgi:hypothetical protein